MMKRRNQQGVALVVTLILLAVITIVVVAFLAVSQRNRALTSTATDQANAQYLADAGLERAQAEVAARLLTQPDLAPVQMLVATNYTFWPGFDPAAPPGARFFNVNYTRTPFDDPNLPAPGLGPIYDPALGVPLAYDQLMQVLTNLYYNPRPPVFVRTNPSPVFPPEFRFYLDLNRNGRFDPTGEQWNMVVTPGGQLVPSGRVTLVGDPEWIGVLENADVPHSATNRFIGRYTYLVVPEGLTLDVNTAHNYAKAYAPGGIPDAAMFGDRFLRNSGVGTYELNLAAFLVGLNTNAWPARGQINPAVDYGYNWTDPAALNTGLAFNDASSLLRYRYRNDPFSAPDLNNLIPRVPAPPPSNGSFEALFGSAAAAIARTNRVDEYATGPVVLTENLPATEAGGDDAVDFPWSGAPNPNRFTSLDELFDGTKVTPAFAARLDSITRSNGTYNSGTYYRLLSQLGTESGAEPDSFVPGLNVDDYTAANREVPYRPPDKINLNWDNRDLRNDPSVAAVDRKAWKAADLKPWEPLAFFTNAAARMLRSQAFLGSDSNIISLNNIMVWPTNNYDGAVHRILQLAANLYDAGNLNGMEGMTAPNEPKFPTVFRPYLRKGYVTNTLGQVQTNVYIAGYQLQEQLAPGGVDPAGFVNRVGYWDLNSTNNVIDLVPEIPDPNVAQPMALGVPLVIGAKKGFPNFNEVAMETMIQLQRNIQLRRLTTSSLPYQTNEFYILGITNVFGVEAWNSYKAQYPRDVTIALEVDFDMAVFGTNSTAGGTTVIQQWPPVAGTRPIETTFAAITNIAASNWRGMGTAGEFKVPLMTNYLFLSNSVWRPRQYPWFVPASSNVFGLVSSTPNEFLVPDWILSITNRVRFVAVDTATRRIIDYANLDRMTWSTNIIDAMTLSDRAGRDSQGSQFWDMTKRTSTPPVSEPTVGLWNQLQVSLGFTTVSESIWRNYSASSPAAQDRALAIDAFRRFAMGLPPLNFPGRDNPVSGNGLVAQAPFAAARRLELTRTYEVNDPFVHYTSYDLAPPEGANDPVVLPGGTGATVNPRLQSLNRRNKRYQPWDSGEGGITLDPRFTDPAVRSSDDWNFPDHKLPTVGWMGRIHRGSPWQTVYLKSTNAILYDANTNRVPAGGPLNIVGQGGWYNPSRTRGALNEHGLPNLATPDKDWRLLDLFTTAPSATATRGKVSINQSGLASWSAVLGGVQMLTNVVGAQPGALYQSGARAAGPIEPGTVGIQRIVDGINLTRDAAPYRGQFRSLGDLLSVPELTLSSPYLYPKDPLGNTLPPPYNANNNLNDATLEWIPQQILSLLRLGEPRVMVYSFGQSLKPAPLSINLDPNYLNLVTNYQITAEHATRTVIEFQRLPPELQTPTNQTRLRAVILESKVLPPPQ